MARQKKPVHRVQMTEGKRNIIHQLLEEYDIQSAEDIQDALKDLLGDTIKEMMEAEMDEHLGYEKSERSDNDDYRNGYKRKQVNSRYGSMEIEVPQDRKSTFSPQIVKKRQKDISDIDQKKLDTAGEKRRITDSSLKESILVIYGYTCQYGKLIGEKHQSFLREDGNPFMEVHHLIPMKASQDFFPRNLDRASNLVCLCPNCHERIHHGSKEEKEKVLKVLYNAMIDGLNYEEIYISYKQLLKYYL